MEEQRGPAVEVTGMEVQQDPAVEVKGLEELDLAAEVTGAPAEPPARLGILVETAGTRGKTTGRGGRERTAEEPGGTKEVRGGLEAVIGGSRVTAIREVEVGLKLEDVRTVFWRPVLTRVLAPAPRYLEPVLPAAPNDASDDKLLSFHNKYTAAVTVTLLLNNFYLTDRLDEIIDIYPVLSIMNITFAAMQL